MCHIAHTRISTHESSSSSSNERKILFSPVINRQLKALYSSISLRLNYNVIAFIVCDVCAVCSVNVCLFSGRTQLKCWERDVSQTSLTRRVDTSTPLNCVMIMMITLGHMLNWNFVCTIGTSATMSHIHHQPLSAIEENKVKLIDSE